mgnify:CR=1 FL=1
MEPKRNVPLIISAFFAIYVIWGSTYLLNKIAVAQSVEDFDLEINAEWLYLMLESPKLFVLL